MFFVHLRSRTRTLPGPRASDVRAHAGCFVKVVLATWASRTENLAAVRHGNLRRKQKSFFTIDLKAAPDGSVGGWIKRAATDEDCVTSRPLRLKLF